MPYDRDGKYGDLIVQSLTLPAEKKTPEALAAYARFGKRVHWIDGGVVPGAFQMNTSWYFASNREAVLADGTNPMGREHRHEAPEILGFYGSDPDDPEDLGGEMELYIDGEKHLLTKSSLVFLPPMLPHCPLYVNRVDRPIFHFSVVMDTAYKAE
ncbi:MAG: hypothetical protein IK136_03040 [Oscillospiraceae bacterium]|nr:hypothetical protein [Oscillospiraceae bacterium]